MSNMIYSDPNYTLIGELDASQSYDWDVFGVWRKSDGTLWQARDSGCSCSSPWDTTTAVDREPYNEAQIREWARGSVSPVEVEALISEIG